MLKLLLIWALLVSGAAAQSDPQKIVDAEHAFAQMAAEKGVGAAFLAYMTDGAVVFNPQKVNARSHWASRKESEARLLWAPNYADISSDGTVGYTTGNWEYRPKGKLDAPVAFGEFVTVWTRQSDGGYKWIIDIGVSHDKPAAYSTDFATSKNGGGPKAPGNLDRSIKKFELVAAGKGLNAAYREFAANDMRSYREGKLPFIGKAGASARANTEAGTISLATSAYAVQAADLAYLLTDYSRTQGDGKTEKGNMLQIWKFYDAKWHLVLDVIKPVGNE
jgi:ketosteroid isomerase-like protein